MLRKVAWYAALKSASAVLICFIIVRVVVIFIQFQTDTVGFVARRRGVSRSGLPVRASFSGHLLAFRRNTMLQHVASRYPATDSINSIKR